MTNLFKLSSFQLEKKIIVAKQYPAEAELIQSKNNLSPLSARILAARGYKADSLLDSYLSPSLATGLEDPSKIRGITECVELLSEYITNKLPVALACDFDVDGLTACAEFSHFLSFLKAPHFVFVPDRFKDGYGLNRQIVEEALRLGCKLLVTIDFGTSNGSELAYAKSLGMRSIVIDHHHVDDKHEEIDIFVNPCHPDCGFADRKLCSAGLVWKVLIALKKILPSAANFDLRTLIDLAALGTICDMVPLTGVNRVIARKGIELIANSPRPGIKSLLQVSGVRNTPNTRDISFVIGPRINAAGRMLHGGVVLELLTTDNFARANEIAYQLHELNLKRQQQEKFVINQSQRLIESKEQMPPVLVVYDPSFHVGVVGIAAQRLVERYHRPAIVLGNDVSDQEIIKGSVRGIQGINILSLLNSSKEYLLKFGGHEAAGGLALQRDKLDYFTESINSNCLKIINEDLAQPVVQADTITSLDELSLESAKELQSLMSPCGQGNKTPILLINNLRVEALQELKNGHLKVFFQQNNRSLEGVLWKQSSHPDLHVRANVDVAFKLEVNNFNGERIQANIMAAKRSSMNE